MSRGRKPPPTDDLTRRFGTSCPVCGAALGVADPGLDEETGERFVNPPSFRLEVGASVTESQQPWRVTLLAGNFPPAESTDPRFNPYDVEFVYLLCGEGHIFPEETPAFRAGAHRDGDARQRVDDFNMVAAIGSPASGKTYLLIRTLSQNLDVLTRFDPDDDPGRIRPRELSPLEVLPTEKRVERFNETRSNGKAIGPTGTESAAYPFGILQTKVPKALEAIQSLIERTVLDGRRRAERWGKGFRQPLVLRTDSGEHRTWTGIADLPGELFMPNSVNRREAGLLSGFDALVWVVDPAVAPRAAEWMVVDPDVDEQAQVNGSLRPGTSSSSGIDVVRINREQIQNAIGRRITVLDGPFTMNKGRPLQMLVAITKCDLVHAALSKSDLTELGRAGQVQRGAATYLSFALDRWMKGIVGADPEAGRLLHYLQGAAQASPTGRRQRIEQVAHGLLRHYSTAPEFWKLMHDGAASTVDIEPSGSNERPLRIRVPSLDDHLDAARRPGSATEILVRDLVMSTIGCGVAYALNQETALLRMHQERWIELRFFLCSPLTMVPIAVDDVWLKPLDPHAQFPPVDERAAGLTQLLLALLERARR